MYPGDGEFQVEDPAAESDARFENLDLKDFHSLLDQTNCTDDNAF